ncbi:DUF397 domain-containing protein [Actinoplanes sp. NPDC000266]
MPRTWFKSSYSVANSACVEVAVGENPGEQVFMRDSKDPAGAVLTFSEAAWKTFVEEVKSDRLRRP